MLSNLNITVPVGALKLISAVVPVCIILIIIQSCLSLQTGASICPCQKQCIYSNDVKISYILIMPIRGIITILSEKS